MADKLTIAIILFIISFIYVMKRKEENFQKKRFRISGKYNKIFFSVKHFAVITIISVLISSICMLIFTSTILD